MGAKVYEVRLTVMEMDVAIDALESAMAGDPSEGDFCWTGPQCEAARRASTKLKHVKAAAGSKTKVEDEQKNLD